MNPVDLIAILLIVIAVILGVRSGALPQLLGLMGAVAAALIGLAVLPAAMPLLDGVPPPIRAIIVLSVLLGLVGLGEALGATGGRAMSKMLGTGFLGALDQVSGGFVGVAQAILVLWLAGGVLASGPFPDLSQIAQRSTALRIVDSILPPPTEIVLGLGQALDNTGLPNVFIGLEQLPAPDIQLPSDALASQIGGRAAGSVLRVIADGCQQRASGSSFVVAPDYLVTNAHVVVGARSIIVQTSTASYQATPVLVDLELDIAVLHAPGVHERPLVFTSSEPVRGDLGATVGYPGGGNEAVTAATVAASYFANGLDVTGQARVTRRILELRAHVIPGDSGGPLMLEDGTVGGVVFAQSKVDPTVGYALAPSAVLGDVMPALDKTAAADTGPCLN